MRNKPSQLPQCICFAIAAALIIAAACLESFILAWVAFFVWCSGTCLMCSYDEALEDLEQDEKVLNEEAFAMLENRNRHESEEFAKNESGTSCAVGRRKIPTS